MIVKVTQSIDDQVEPYQHAEEDKSMTDGQQLLIRTNLYIPNKRAKETFKQIIFVMLKPSKYV